LVERILAALAGGEAAHAVPASEQKSPPLAMSC
jgi:hypothetical protein